MAQIRNDTKFPHHDSNADTEAILWCVLEGSNVRLTAGSGHNVMTKKITLYGCPLFLITALCRKPPPV